MVEQAGITKQPQHETGLKLASIPTITSRHMTDGPARYLLKRIFAVAISLGLAAGFAGDAAQAARKKPPTGPSLPLIRDAEIEALIRLYARPIFKAASVNPGSVRVYIVRNDKINAFVAEGQRMFLHTGLLTRAKTPNQLIGVIAHETGHLAGGHLARMGRELEKASIESIIGMLVGAAAAVGGAATGSREAAQAGQGIMIGTQGVARRNFLSYTRDMESSADQAALTYLKATQQSPKGMLDMFQILANESLASTVNADPYLFSHPMPLERIRNLEREAKLSPYYGTQDRPEMVLRHALMQAKLIGFIGNPQTVFQRYPASDTSLPARYARAIATFRRGDTANAIPIIDSLIRDLPQDPYFWELKGQALLEGGQARAALAPLKEANRLLPKSGLLQILYAQALMATESPANDKLALSLLTQARRSEPDAPGVYSYLAVLYGRQGDIGRAELATAESAVRMGDLELATEKAKNASSRLKQGSPEWLRASDILNFIERKKDN
jgi:predicted Zn-dependent protease